MTTLKQQQNSFQRYLLEGQPDFLEMVVGTTTVSAESRLMIYNNAYRYRLIDALASNFPVLYLYLGAEQFHSLASSYMNTHPSVYRSIRWYGDQLPNFLYECDEYRDHPYCSELAEFEWCMTLAFDSADALALTIDDIICLPPESWVNMRFQAHPALRRINFHWNIVAIWEAISTDNTPPALEHTDCATPWLIWRHELENQFCTLPTDEAWAIDALLNGATFGEIGEGLCQWVTEEEAGLRAASFLKSWIQAGLITNITLEQEANHE